jgi:hypothetical protein
MPEACEYSAAPARPVKSDISADSMMTLPDAAAAAKFVGHEHVTLIPLMTCISCLNASETLLIRASTSELNITLVHVVIHMRTQL